MVFLYNNKSTTVKIELPGKKMNSDKIDLNVWAYDKDRRMMLTVEVLMDSGLLLVLTIFAIIASKEHDMFEKEKKIFRNINC